LIEELKPTVAHYAHAVDNDTGKLKVEPQRYRITNRVVNNRYGRPAASEAAERNRHARGLHYGMTARIDPRERNWAKGVRHRMRDGGN